MSAKNHHFRSTANSSITLASSMSSASNQSSAPDVPIKISISTPINLNSPPQFVTLPQAYTHATEILNPPLLNHYTGNANSETTDGGQCLHSDCQVKSNNDAIEEEAFIMNINSLNSPGIDAEKHDPTLGHNTNLHIDTFTNQHLSLQHVPKTLTHHHQPPLLTTLLPPPTSLNPNDVIMTSSTTFSLLRSVSPNNTLPNSTHSSQIFNEAVDCNNEDRKPYISGNLDSLREEPMSMTTLENTHCSTLLF